MRLAVLLALVLAMPACKSKTPDPPAALVAVMSAYEELRAGLAADRSVTAAAAKTRAAAESAASAAPNLKPKLDAVASTATELERAPASDLEAQRVKFGELSRAMLGLAQAEPALQNERFVYECPMAKGYRKWVQAKQGIDNPYMGKAMLECGAESTWAP